MFDNQDLPAPVALIIKKTEMVVEIKLERKSLAVNSSRQPTVQTNGPCCQATDHRRPSPTKWKKACSERSERTSARITIIEQGDVWYQVEVVHSETKSSIRRSRFQDDCIRQWTFSRRSRLSESPHWRSHPSLATMWRTSCTR